MPRKKYPGSLNEPLPPPPARLGTDNYEAAVRRYGEEIAKRYMLLMDHFDIDRGADDRWFHLALKLAEQHVPGLTPWTPPVDTDRHVRILSRMLFMMKVRGFSEGAAAKAVSEVCPDLGNKATIRSAFREQKVHQDLKELVKIFERMRSDIDAADFEQGLADGIGDDIDKLREVEKLNRGRPKNNKS